MLTMRRTWAYYGAIMVHGLRPYITELIELQIFRQKLFFCFCLDLEFKFVFVLLGDDADYHAHNGRRGTVAFHEGALFFLIFTGKELCCSYYFWRTPFVRG